MGRNVWMDDGRKLTGCYGTWRGDEVEMKSHLPLNGQHRLIKDGGERPGPEWREIVYPNRFARTPYHYWLDVPEAEVSETHRIVASGYVPMTNDRDYDFQVHVRIIAQDGAGRLAVETENREPTIYWRPLEREFGFEEYERSFMFGWVPGDRVTDIRIERQD